MQYILDQNEYDEYMQLKTMKEYPIEKPDELIFLLTSSQTTIDVHQFALTSFPAQYKNEVMIKVDLENLSAEAKDIIMSRITRKTYKVPAEIELPLRTTGINEMAYQATSGIKN